MPNYDSCPIIACKSTALDSGSINILIARKLPHDLFALSIFLVDVYKLGLKDAFGSERLTRPEFSENYDMIMKDYTNTGITFTDLDILEAKSLIARGLQIASIVGTPSVKKSLLECVGNMSEVKVDGSPYKCYECGKGELSDADCNKILKVAKKELALGVAGTPKEKKLWIECNSCKNEDLEDEELDNVLSDDSKIATMPKGDKEPSLKEMNKVLDAAVLYYNFFIPVHDDGRTPAEAYGNIAPKWLSELIKKYKEGPLKGEEADMNKRAVTDLSNHIVASITKDIFENEDKSERSKVVLLLLEELKDGTKRKDLVSYRKPVTKNRNSLKDENQFPKIIVPFMTVYGMKNPKKVKDMFMDYSKTESTLKVKFYDKQETPHLRIDNKEWISVFTEESGIKLGTLNFEEEFLLVSSIVEERNRALCQFVTHIAGDKLEFIDKVKNFEPI